MCGIFGIVNGKPAASDILDGLRTLEYRGYDSAGIAVVNDHGIERRRAVGKLDNLRQTLGESAIEGHIGIGHTRWATHGRPSERNAHPHATERVAVVHNGIIENHAELRRELSALGYAFESETDTEVIPKLVNRYLEEGMEPAAAARSALNRLEGSYAVGMAFAGEPDLLIAARKGSPLAVAVMKDGAALASDALALGAYAQNVIYLEEGDIAFLRRGHVDIEDSQSRPALRKAQAIRLLNGPAGKGEYRHFMEKEIFEQPARLSDTLAQFAPPGRRGIRLPHLPFDPKSVERLSLIACGTSCYAAQIAKYWIEALAGIPVDVDVASEFRYRRAPRSKASAALVISQSGETADTLAVMRHLKEHGVPVLGLVNVGSSSIAREADLALMTQAGPEIGVASTKAFTAQLMALAAFAIGLGTLRGTLSHDEARVAEAELVNTPALVAEALRADEGIRPIARDMRKASSILYIGRGTAMPLAFEGALKLKEITYIHAEGFGAGELKHGPIALVDESVPVIVVAPHSELFSKTLSNLQEVQARGAKIILISDAAGLAAAKGLTAYTICLPTTGFLSGPIVAAVPLQLLAYHVALCKGTDIDRPRNLAKSVTVE